MLACAFLKSLIMMFTMNLCLLLISRLCSCEDTACVETVKSAAVLMSVWQEKITFGSGVTPVMNLQ